MSEWEKVPAGTVAAQRKDIVTLEPGVEYQTMGVRWYGRGAYDRGIGTTKTIKAKRLFRAHKGDFVFNRIDTQNGAFDVVPAALDGALATNEFPLYVVDPDRLSERFLLLYFQQSSVLAQIDAMRAGSEGRSRWKEADFEAWRIPLPSPAEQRRIVDVIAAVDTQFMALSEEIEAETRTLSALRAEVPDSDEVPISSVVEGIDGGRSVQTTGEAPVRGKARVLKLSAVQLGQFDADEAKRLDDSSGYTTTHLVSDGDLLITRSNTPERVGYVAVAIDVPPDTYMPDLIWRIRPDKSRCLATYLGHLLSANEFRARITGSASGTNKSMQKINKRSFGAIKVPVPESIAEQEAFVARCDAMTDVIRVAKAELSYLRAFRSALLTSLFKQEIEIPESYDALLEEVS